MKDHPGFATTSLFDRYQDEMTDHTQCWAVRPRMPRITI